MHSNVFSNLVALLDVWTQRQTGHLRLCNYGASTSPARVIEVASGGLLRVSDWTTLMTGLEDSVCMFTPARVSGKGDRRSMGALLSVASRRQGIDLSEALDQADDETVHSLAAPISLLSLMPGLALPEEFALMSGSSGTDDRQSALLAQGIARVSLGDWEGADEVLTLARDHRFDHPRTLAWLAWARIHNPRRAPHERSADALSLISVAEQLAPHDAEVAGKAQAIRQELQSVRSRARGESLIGATG